MSQSTTSISKLQRDGAGERGRSKATIAADISCRNHLTNSRSEPFHDLHDSKVLERLQENLKLAKADLVSDRAMRLPEVLHLLGGIGKSSWYGRLNPKSAAYDPMAPRPFKLGESKRSSSFWWYSEVRAYLETCSATSRLN